MTPMEYVDYLGSDQYLRDTGPHRIIRETGKGAYFQSPNGGEEFRPWHVLSRVRPDPFKDESTDIMNPHASTIDAIDAEIKRLDQRMTELRAARQVIAGL